MRCSETDKCQIFHVQSDLSVLIDFIARILQNTYLDETFLEQVVKGYTNSSCFFAGESSVRFAPWFHKLWD